MFIKTSLYEQRDFSTRNYGVRTRDGLDMNVPSCKEKVGEEMVYLFFKKKKKKKKKAIMEVTHFFLSNSSHRSQKENGKLMYYSG